MNDYRNEHLDRAIALIVLIVFIAALFYAVMIINQQWEFFRWFFCAIVVAISFWLVTMLFSIVWRFNAKTQAIMTNGNIPIQLSQKKPIIHEYQSEYDYPDYDSMFAVDDEE